jgi:hypothetical protein
MEKVRFYYKQKIKYPDWRRFMHLLVFAGRFQPAESHTSPLLQAVRKILQPGNHQQPSKIKVI